MHVPAAHRGCLPSTLTEVSYRAGARPHGQLPVALRTRELKKNEPHAGGPIDPPKATATKGPARNQHARGSRPGDGSLTPAGTPA